MATVSDYLSELYRIKSLIRNSIVRKGGVLTDKTPFADYSAAIDGIVTAGNSPSYNWKPNDSWWDIETILRTDTTEGYVAKCIALYSNIEDSIALQGADAYRTSDGKFYETSSATHYWDTSKDKECTLGYSTRYVIYYFKTYDEKLNVLGPTTLYLVCSSGYWSFSRGNGTCNLFDKNNAQFAIVFKCSSDRFNYLKGLKVIDSGGFVFDINNMPYFTSIKYVSALYTDTAIDKCASTTLTFAHGIDSNAFGSVEDIKFYLNSKAFNKRTEYIVLPLATKALTIEGANSTQTLNSITAVTLSTEASTPQLSSITINKNNATLVFGNIDLRYCYLLTHKSYASLINGIQDETGGTNRTLTVNQYGNALLTTSDKQLLASKNWTLSVTTM